MSPIYETLTNNNRSRDAGKNNALDWGILHFRKAYS